MVAYSYDDFTSVHAIEDRFEVDPLIEPLNEDTVRRGEDKPRVLEHRYKRYWNSRYGKIRNKQRLERKRKMKEMKSSSDENGVSMLSQQAKWNKKYKQSKTFLKRLEMSFNSNYIEDTVYDHNIVSNNEFHKTKESLNFDRLMIKTDKPGLEDYRR